MTITQRIGQATYREHQFELMRQAGEFSQLCHMLMLSRGNSFQLKELARENRSRAGQVAKAAVEAGGLGAGSTWGSQLSDYGLLVAGFAQALSNFGLFDRLLPDMKRVPLASATVGAITVPASGYVIADGNIKNVSKFSLTNNQLSPTKAAAIVVMSQELLRNVADAQRLITAEMINAAALAVDVQFLSVATSGVSVATSVGSTALSVRNDIQNMLRQIGTDARSRLYLATTSPIAENLALMGATSTSGAPAFEQMTPQGGTIAGIQVVVSDAVSQGQMVLIDAQGFAGAIEAATLQVMKEGTIMAADPADSPVTASSNFQSLWQLNISALLCERWFGVQRLRTNSVAVVSNTSDYGSGNSPP